MGADHPRTWRELPLAECMAAIIDYRGKTPTKTSFGVPLVTAKVIKGGRIERPNEVIAAEDYDAWMRRGLPEAGDVVMTTEAPLGEVAQLDGRKVGLAQRVITLGGKPGFVDNTYLKFMMQSGFVQDQLRARASGTTVLGIKQSELRRVSEGGVWRSLEPQLSSKVGAYMFSIGFPRGVVERMPPEQVIAWVDADPDERASMVAKLASKNFANDDTLASRIVGTYGDRDDVASAFFSEYVSGSWSGPASAHWEQLATSIEEAANRTKLPKLRRWATDAARSLRQMAERDRQREEEEDLRGR